MQISSVCLLGVSNLAQSGGVMVTTMHLLVSEGQLVYRDAKCTCYTCMKARNVCRCSICGSLRAEAVLLC
jgi:hypothetical protein